MRLKLLAIDVHVSVDPVHRFLDEPEGVRASTYLVDCATAFQVHGPELDGTRVTWDGDLRPLQRAGVTAATTSATAFLSAIRPGADPAKRPSRVITSSCEGTIRTNCPPAPAMK